MDLPDRVDVIVAGSTIAGLVAARGLAEGGASVLLTGPEGPDDLGVAHVGLAEHPGRLLASLGLERWTQLVDLQRRSMALLEGQPVDQVWAAVLPNEYDLLDASVDALDAVGLAAVPMDRVELQDRGIQADRGFRVTGGSALLDPPAERLRWRAAAEAAGARSTAASVRWADEDLDGLLVQIDGRKVRCEVLVVAHGAGVARWSDWLAERLTPVREQALLLGGSLPSLGGRAGHGYTGFRPWGPAEVAIAGCRWATPHLEVGEISPVTVPAIQNRLEDFARNRLGLRSSASARWAWIEDHSCDELPIVGPMPGSARWLACVGVGGAEWSLGPALGRMIVDGLLGGGLPTPPMLSTVRLVA